MTKLTFRKLNFFLQVLLPSAIDEDLLSIDLKVLVVDVWALSVDVDALELSDSKNALEKKRFPTKGP